MENVSDISNASRSNKVHLVFNIILFVLATCAFVFVALFTYSAIDAYIDMQNFNGEGINSGALGFAFSFVFVLIAALATVPLSVICAVSSGSAVKKREGVTVSVSRVTLWVSVAYAVISPIVVAILYIISQA